MSQPIHSNLAAAQKCSGCHNLSIHAVIQITMYSMHNKEENIKKRVLACQNCGKISTK